MLFVVYFPKGNFPIDNFRSGNFPIVTFSKQHLPKCTSNVKRAFCGATGCNEGPCVATRMGSGRVLRIGWARRTSIAARMGQKDECCDQDGLEGRVAARMGQWDECCGQDQLEGRVVRLGWARRTSVASRMGQMDECCDYDGLEGRVLRLKQASGTSVAARTD